MKRILIILIILIGLLAGGAYFLFIKAITPTDVPTTVLNTENAITTSDTIAIASVDLAHMRRIEDMFKSIKDPSPIIYPKQIEPKATSSLIHKLKKQGINLYKDTDYALATINVGQNTPAYTFALFGRFSKNKIKQAIQQSHILEESTAGYWLITEIAEEKKSTDPCAVPSSVKSSDINQLALYIQKNSILLTSPELMPIVLKRIKSQSQASISLDKWRNFRKDKVFAGLLMSPKEVERGAVGLSSSLLLGSISKQPLTNIYGGAVVSILPSPGFTLVVDVHSSDSTWPVNFKSKYDALLIDIASDIKEMPTLESVINSLTVQSKDNVLSSEVVLSRSILDNLQNLPAEFMKMIFSNMSFGDDKTETEQIVKVEDIEKFDSKFDFSSVKPFIVGETLYKSGSIAGPFGVRLKKIGLMDNDNTIIELKVVTEGQGFENLTNNKIQKIDETTAASLIVTSVEDKDGNNLLREEQCGEKRNIVASSLTAIRDKELVDDKWISKSIKVFGEKNVRLQKKVKLSQITNIKGKIVIRAATNTNVKTIQAPFAKKILDTGKVRLYFKKSHSSTVKYDLSGEKNRILAIRAKNSEGQYLASSDSIASGNKVQTISKRFKGKIAAVEVVLADDIENKEYPFILNQINLQYGLKSTGFQIGMVATSKKSFLRKHAKVKHKNVCKDKQQVELSSFVICLNKFNNEDGKTIGADFDVVGPYDEALLNDLAAGVISIDSVKTVNSKRIKFNKNQKVNFKYKFDTNFNDKTKDWEITNKRLHAANVSVLTNAEELKGKIIKLIKGSLTIRIPKKPRYFEVSASELGISKKSDNGISAKLVAFEDWDTYIYLQGNVDKVMRFMPVTIDKSILKTSNDSIVEKAYDTLGLSKEEKVKVEKSPKQWQGKMTIYGEPAAIRIYYADDFEIIKHKFEFSI